MEIIQKCKMAARECRGCGAFILRQTKKAFVKDLGSVVVFKCEQCGREYEVRKPVKIHES